MNYRRFLLWILAAGLMILAFLPLHFRWDATASSQYSLQTKGKNLLKKVENPLEVKVFLTGQMPADFQRLARETSFFLQQIQQENGKVRFSFVNPAKIPNSEVTLKAKGMSPALIPSIDGNTMEQTLVYPYAEIVGKGQRTVVNLMKGAEGENLSDQVTSAQRLLPYNLLSGIAASVEPNKKKIGILVNQDELRPQEFRDFLQLAQEKYSPAPIIPANGRDLTFQDMSQLQQADLLVIAKPRKPFSEVEKQLLDQYMVKGGRTLWMMEPVAAEMDSLFRSKEIVAVPNEVNLTDFFFNYGVRLGSLAVKDHAMAANIRVVVGEINGNPQYQSFSWPYFPVAASLINPNGKQRVKLQFPGNIELLPRPGYEYQPLLKTSAKTSLKKLPNPISLSELANPDSLGRGEVRTGEQLLAVRIKGKFKSGYANRVERRQMPDFQAEGKENEMVVIADGDIGRNSVIQGKALPMAQDILSEESFANRSFLEDILDHLLGDSDLSSLKSSGPELVKMDREKLNSHLKLYRMAAIGLPLVLFLGLGFIAVGMRNRKNQMGY